MSGLQLWITKALGEMDTVADSGCHRLIQYHRRPQCGLQRQSGAVRIFPHLLHSLKKKQINVIYEDGPISLTVTYTVVGVAVTYFIVNITM